MSFSGTRLCFGAGGLHFYHRRFILHVQDMSLKSLHGLQSYTLEAESLDSLRVL